MRLSQADVGRITRVENFADFQILQSPADNLFYWCGTGENSHLDSPKGYRIFEEALNEALETIEFSTEVEQGLWPEQNRKNTT